MAAEDYKKYKEKKPEDTVYRIWSILHEIGLSTVCEWTENEYEGCYSNRVTIYPTTLGTNGKGTDRMYAMASGYAELMERIQNSLLYVGALSPEDSEYGGFQLYPDQKQLSFEELFAQEDSFTEHFFRKLECETEAEKKKILQCYREWGNTSCIPFADIDRNRIVYLPANLVISTCGSNGMAAGNTREEALVQGFAEIFERYVNRKIVLEHICPPSVPREVLARIPSLYRIICEIEKDSAYRVDIKDCSLGRGLPVAAIIIVNQNTGRFGVKFASHPSFAVALERTLTEAFQGKNLDDFTEANCIGTDAQVHHRDNILNTMKTGNGVYPKELLADRPDYAYDPGILMEATSHIQSPLPLRSELNACHRQAVPAAERAVRLENAWDGAMELRDNTEMLRYMMDLVRREGGHPLIHDSSYLGFPAYFIVVPGMSEIYPIDRIRCREVVTASRVRDSFGHLGALTDAEADRMIRYITFKEDSVLENELSWISLRPLVETPPHVRSAAERAVHLENASRWDGAVETLPGASESTRVMKAMLLYQRGRFEEAARETDKVVSYFKWRQNEGEWIFYKCCREYMDLRANGSDARESGELIEKLYPPEIAGRVSWILAEEKTAVKRMYPATSCYDCGHCEMGEKGVCDYRETAAVLRKIKDAMKKNIPNQEDLLELREGAERKGGG